MESHKVYKGEKAASYDENAQFEKGNRILHKYLLEDILTFLDYTPKTFIDLGCGTSFFSSSFFDLFPNIKGVLIDGSDEMLAQATEKLSPRDIQVEYVHSSFQDLVLKDVVDPIDVIFSCLAIHHIDEAQKEILYNKIFNQLTDRGVFILFDLFALKDPSEQKLLAHIAYRDIQRKLKKYLGIEQEGIELEELSLGNIKRNDTREKKREGDQESYLDDIVGTLKKIGFKHVILVNQENRFISIVAFKKN
ncbi:class I SAM-dependent methyltransferase [Croceitalea marina]|uniref:Class I SAM-dependent methyltransferase n=1 Tax=Croceitalea marina TaxID=1775166 RepID=A0ABW5MUP1_9FLAO